MTKRQILEWRQGFLTAMSERLFPELPTATERELTGKIRDNSAFAEGYNYGQDCPLAVSLPDEIGGDYECSDQYNRAAWFAAGAVVVGILILWALSGTGG